VMALVIFFVPQPRKGVAEMARAVRPGGPIAAYAWDLEGGGFPLQVIHEELEAMGVPPLLPPSADASRFEVLRNLWEGAGLTGIETRSITVERVFPDFEDMWAINLSGPRLSAQMKDFAPAARQELKTRVRRRLTPDRDDRITCTARANAIKGHVPQA
jgi:hypothetical protein